MIKTLRNFVLVIWSKIRRVDRFFWVVLSRIWTPWRKPLVIVKPDTVVHWHRKGFKLFWKIKSKGPGRPQVSREIRHLVRRMAKANPSWGAPRIHGELLRLGFEVSERTVSSLMPRRPKNSKPSQTWRTFLKNHAGKCWIYFFHCSDSLLQHLVRSGDSVPLSS